MRGVRVGECVLGVGDAAGEIVDAQCEAKQRDFDAASSSSTSAGVDALEVVAGVVAGRRLSARWAVVLLGVAAC